MPEAYVLGAGQSPFGSYPEETSLSLFETAFDRAFASVECAAPAVDYPASLRC